MALSYIVVLVLLVTPGLLAGGGGGAGAGAGAGAGSGEQNGGQGGFDVTKEQLRLKYDELRTETEHFIAGVRQTVNAMTAPGLTSAARSHLEGEITSAFEDGARIYNTLRGYTEKVIGHLWEELEKKSEGGGGGDGFEPAPHRCNSLSVYEMATHAGGPIARNLDLAWIFLARDAKCVLREYERIFEGSRVLENGGRLSIEEAMEAVGTIVLHLMKVEESLTEFHRAAMSIFPNFVPDFSQHQQTRELTDQLIGALLKRVLTRRLQNKN